MTDTQSKASERAALAADLPSNHAIHWVPKRKAAVVRAIAGGAIELDEALRRYRLSQDELRTWQSRLAREGVGGLRMAHTTH